MSEGPVVMKYKIFKIIVYSFLNVLWLFFLISCTDTNQDSKNEGSFTNPILAGFYPDPSICKADNYYFIVNSTFSYFPGIPVFQSKDLVNWKLIGHAMDRAEQMDLTGLGVSRGIFAPAIAYRNDLFYIICTLVDAGGNFVITSNSPEGPWSNPVWLPEINGIDPSMFFDGDGKAYIFYNSIPPDNKALYDGHRTIRMYEFDIQNLKVTGEEKIIVNGGVDITREPAWIEAPHVYKVNDFYYLICAEGGTADQHSEVVFRSKNVDGPYIPYEKNPILTQRHLDPQREYPITSTGHADLIQTDAGEWWAVFLGCRPYRPYEKGYHNNGRETFLAPVHWIDGWPVINPQYEEIQYEYPLPVQSSVVQVDIPYSGNFTIRYEFNKSTLHKSWVFLRTPHEKWYELDQDNSILNIKLRPETCSGKSNPSFIGRRQQHIKGSVSASMKFEPASENEKAGLLIFQNETHYYFFCKSLIGSEYGITLYKSTESEEPDQQLKLISSQLIPKRYQETEILLKIESNGPEYSFYYAFSEDQWMPLIEKVDGTFIRQIIPHDFAGAMYALYASSFGQSSENLVSFNWFKYEGNDEVYITN